MMGEMTSNPGRQLRLSVILILALVVMGTVGLHVTGGHSWFQSLYLTTIILTTVGMEPVGGAEKPVAMLLMIGGIFTTVYAAGNLVAFVVGGEIRKHMERRKILQQIAKLRQHHIIVGYGRMGKALCAALAEKKAPFVLVERSPAKVQEAEHRGYLVIVGDAQEESVFEEAKIHHARSLAACLPKDADNVFITLTARAMNASLNIISRAEEPSTEPKLIRAGADRVICPPVLSATKVSSMMLNPVTDHGEHATFVATSTGIRILEIPADELPILIDKPLGENHVRTRTGVTVVAVDRRTKRELNPTALFIPGRGDKLILVGPEGFEAKLRELYGPKAARTRPHGELNP
jgi:voltage-gated potassium channel